MKNSLTNCEIKTFHKNGFLLKKSFFKHENCNVLLSELDNFDKNEIKNTEESRSTFLKNKINSKIPFSGLTYLQKAELICPSIKGFMNRKLLKACSALLGEDDIYFGYNEIHIRQPYTKHLIPAHQDNFYFCLKNGLALTCYIYLTEQSRVSGGLGFLESSTKSTTLDHEKSAIEGFSSFNKNKENLANKFTYPDTYPGDVIFHYSQTFHRADSNLSSKATASISIRAFSHSKNQTDKSLESKYLKNLKFNRN